jgi:hypothetical protein
MYATHCASYVVAPFREKQKPLQYGKDKKFIFHAWNKLSCCKNAASAFGTPFAQDEEWESHRLA